MAEQHEGDLKKAVKKQVEKANLARSSKARLGGLDEKLEVATAAMRKRPTSHTVVSGDTLTSIAKKYGKADWKAIYEANKDVIGDDPNKLRVGLKLKLPR